jgi:hypothetical protein
MPTIQYFNGKRVVLPGVYSTIKSGVQNPPEVSDYSKILVIDTGSQAGYGGGSGINGAINNGLDSVYEFRDLATYREFLKGGILWKCAEGLFKPDGGDPGASVVYHVKAATTEKSSMDFSPTGGGDNGGVFNISPKDEGVGANGVLDAGNNDNLYKGFAYSIEAGIKDTNKWIFKLWRGSYTGLHTDSIPYDEVAQADAFPILITQSPEFDNVQELIDWANSDANFGDYFILNTGTVTGTGAVVEGDIPSGYQVSAGGTETYDVADLTAVLEAIKDIQYTHILCDKWGKDDYDGATVGAIVSHIETDAKFSKYMFYGGGKDKTEFTQADGSIAQAAFFDTKRVLVVHGDAKKASTAVAEGFRRWPTVYKSAVCVGKIAGLAPQVPGTFKSIAIDGEYHNLTDLEKERALEGGVFATYFDADFNNFVMLQAINSIQNNINLILPNGDSFEHQIERIKTQLNTDLSVNAKKQLLGQPNGVNRNTLNETIVKNWTEGFLETKKATDSQDNLIIRYQSVTVTRDQDTYKVTYEFEPNGPINKLLFTGFIID